MSSSRIPTYSRHASGQARVWIGGQHIYLGPFGSLQSKRKYREIVDRWQRERDFGYRPDLTIGQLALLYDVHAREHYKKNGQATSEIHCIRAAIRFLLANERQTLASQFGPKKLKQIQHDMIGDGQCRRTINRHCERIRRMFAWGVSEELIAPDILTSLRTVRGLSAGRSDAKEREPVGPVDLADVLKIRRHVSRQVMGMVLLQLRTGARPGEVVQIRGQDLDMTGDVWVFVPMSHKTEHRGRSRAIFIGRRGQRIVRKFLKPEPGAYLFSPADAERERSAQRRAARQSPMTPSQAARRPRKNRSRPLRGRYTVAAYRRAIERACRRVGIEPWGPNGLRHTSATFLRQTADIETVRTVLGHASAVTSEIYAERDWQSARRLIADCG